MKNFIFLLLSVCLIFLFHCAADHKTTQPTFIPDIPNEKCDAPIIDVGDSWTFRNTIKKKEWGMAVVGIENFKKLDIKGQQQTKIYIIESDNSKYKKGYDVRNLECIVDIDSNGKKIPPTEDWSASFDFPLYVGKKWSKMMGGFGGSKLYTYNVVSFENITVPAGTFQSFKIEFVDENLVTTAKQRISLWYSPEVKWFVKFYGPVWAYTVDNNIELKSFKLAGKQPTTSAAR
jgi:hypothetical protein